MKIVIINGSPKGKYSTTLHTCLYLKEKFPQHEYDFISAGSAIRSWEKDFSEAEKKLAWADLLLFSYPVYTFIVPSQLHHFIELIKEHQVNLNGKFATQITTSKHFYDVTAHTFIRENCQDLGLKYINGLSADMDDLLKKEGQKAACDFFQYVSYCMANDLYEPFPQKPPAPAHKKVEVPESKGNHCIANGQKTVALVADLAEDDTQLECMIERFKAEIPCQVRTINIHEFPFQGGCVSCFHCSGRGQCIYHDGFDRLLREQIQSCDAIVLAFSIRDHSMGSVFKTYDDRQFCNGHRTVTMGMPFGYLVAGDLSREPNLEMIIRGRAEVGGNFLAGVATDETAPNREIDNLCQRLSYAMEHHYVQPSNFLGVGGMKIFRDLIWLMQGMMRADHRFYRDHGQYDFPQKKFGTMLAMYLVGGMMNNEKLRKKLGNNLNEGMISSYRKVVEAAKKENLGKEEGRNPAAIH